MSDTKKAKSSTKKVKTIAAGNTIFDLPDKIDIASAISLTENIKAAYTSTNITFNAKHVEKITTPGIQILIAAAVNAKIKGGKVTITEPSEIFINNISVLGFSNQLKEWMDSNG